MILIITTKSSGICRFFRVMHGFGIQMSPEWQVKDSCTFDRRNSFAMNSNRRQMIANLIKEGRMTKGFTQKELSELSNVSVRSIQRIENAELVPRSYTLKTLAGILDLPFESFQKEELVQEQPSQPSKRNTAQKVILSIGICIVIILLAIAFVAQAPKFPETEFELFNFSAVIVVLMTAILFFIWRK